MNVLLMVSNCIPLVIGSQNYEPYDDMLNMLISYASLWSKAFINCNFSFMRL